MGHDTKEIGVDNPFGDDAQPVLESDLVGAGNEGRRDDAPVSDAPVSDAPVSDAPGARDAPVLEPMARSRRRFPSNLSLVVVAAISVAALFAGLVGLQRVPEPPRFLARSGAASFAEMMSEPPTFIYGSSIHLWIYDKADGPAEIAVTGHADSSTCSRASGAFLNAMLEKAPDGADLFVAGAGRLMRHENAERRDELAVRTKVKRFLELEDKKAEYRFLVTYAESRAVQSGSDVPSAKELDTKLAEIERELEALKQDPDVIAYRRETASGDAFATLSREATRLSQTSGLLQVHRLPADLADAVRARIAKAAMAGTPSVVGFSDLLEGAKVDEAVVLADVLRIGNATPLVLEIPAASLSSAAFKEAVANNRKGVEYAMVGDAEERRRFYKETIKRDEDERAACARLTTAQRAEIITLDQTCTVDGVCFRSPHPEQMPRSQYCDKRISQNIALVREWDARAKALLSEITTDKDGGGSRVDQMNHGTIIDSLLRDWALPLSRGQEAFDHWRAELRGSTWQILRNELDAARVDVATVSGEHVVFSAEIVGTKVTIRPVHVIDLARAVVVVDPRSGATRVADAWEQRALVRSGDGESAEARQARAVASVDQALDMVERGDVREADAALHQAFSLDASAAAGRIENRYRSMVRDDQSSVAELTAKVRPVLRSAGLSAALQQLHDDSTTEPDLIADTLRVRALTVAYPEAPVELYLRLVFHLAQCIVAVEAQRTGSSSRPELWSVVEMLSRADAGSYRATRDALARALGEDPGDAIAGAIALMEKRAPAFLAEARKARGFPQQSSGEFEKLVGTVETLTLFETEAISVEKLRQLLRHASSASQAAEGVAASSTPDLHATLKHLDEANTGDASAPLPLLTSAQERIRGFISNGYRPDTLARMEAAGMVSRASDQLVRFSNSFFESEFSWLRGLRDHARLGARARYEAGDYGAALEVMFPDRIAVALAYPALSWEVLDGDWTGSAVKVNVHSDGANLVVAASRSGRWVDVLRITGLDESERQSLETRIAGAPWQASGRGRVSEQVLMLAIPAGPRLIALRKLVLEASRLAVVRAMVYGCAPPARDLVPLFGRCLALEAHRYDRVDGGPVTGVRVPPLALVSATAYGK